MSIHVGRYPGSPLPPTAPYLTQSYEPTRTASGATIQRQAPEGERDRSHDGEYRVTAPDGRDLGWHLNFASALRAEREAACSHPEAMRQPRLPSGSRCGACDETFS